MEVLHPIAVLGVGAFFAYLIGRLTRARALTGLIAFAALLAAGNGIYHLGQELSEEFYASWPQGAAWRPLFAYLRADSLGVFVATVAVGLSALVAVFSMRYMHKANIGKFYALLLLMTAGMVGIAFSGDLFNLYVFFELMAVSSFVLVAFHRDQWEPVEAGVKYLVMSTVGSSLALLGIGMVYMYTGSLNLMELPTLLTPHTGTPQLFAIIALLVVGFGVKAAFVPLHTWLPDAHSAAPSGISAMLSGIVIEAGLIAMVKSLAAVAQADAGLIFAVLALVTMFVGNLMALKQTDLKRMFAYSSVAQMGYILMGVGFAFGFPALAGFSGMRGGLFHILNHAIMKGGAFLCAGVFLYLLGTRELSKLSGLGRRLPVVSVCFIIFALALAGTPPLNGFMSKLFICRAGVDVAGWGLFFILMLIFNSVISLFYYLGVINTVVFGAIPADQPTEIPRVPFLMVLPIVVLALLCVLLGVFPEMGLQLVDPAAAQLADMLGGIQ